MSVLAGSRMNPKKFAASQIKYYIILIIIALVMLLPLIYIVNHAFKPLDELFAFPPKFFVQKPTFENFIRLFKAGSTTIIPMSVYLLNSIIVTLITVVFNLLITVCAAYALSKKKYKFTGKLVSINQTALMDQVPNDLIEAASVEGANDLKIIMKIIIPMVKPSLATVGILTFQAVWNNTSTSTLYITNEKLKTFAYYLNTLTMSTTGNTIVGVGMQAASTVIIFLPNLIIFLILQSQVMSTMAYSGIK